MGGFFESFFFDDPSYSLEDAEAVVWENYPTDFRDYWGLDAAAPPEGMSHDDWIEYRSLDQLVEKLAGGAKHLIRPKSTREDQFTLFAWLSEEAANTDTSVNEALEQAKGKIPEELWLDIWRVLKFPTDAGDPRVKRAFMQNCMQLQVAELFPLRLDRMADRLFRLSTFLVRKPSQRVREYLPRVAECYLRSMDLELAVMARAVLDAALQDAYTEEQVAKGVGSWGEVTLERRIQFAVSQGPFSDSEVLAAAQRIRKDGNAAAHANLGLVIAPEETIMCLMRCLTALDTSGS